MLAAPQNSSHTAPSLRVLLTGCVEGPDLQLQRQCFIILQRLVEAWAGSDAASLSGFNSYILSEVLPRCFAAPAQAHFDLKDAAALPLLESIASLQKAILAKMGAEFIAYLRERQLPSMGAPRALCDEYARVVAEGDVTQLRDFLRQQLVGR